MTLPASDAPRDAEDFWAELRDYDVHIRSIFATENSITRALRDFPVKEHPAVGDLGCGVGNSFKYLGAFRAVYGVDFSENMLSQARLRLEPNVTLIRARLEDVTLPERCALILALGSVMPENGEHFFAIMDNIVRNTADGGTIMLYLPSMESRTFAFHKQVDILTEQGRTSEEIERIVADDMRRFRFHPLGYMLTESRLLQKQWLREEIEYRLARYGFRSIRIEKFELDWDKQVKRPHLGHLPRHWNWAVTIRR